MPTTTKNTHCMEIIGFLFILDFNELKVTVITYNTKKTIALTNVVYFEFYDKTAYEPKRNNGDFLS